MEEEGWPNFRKNFINLKLAVILAALAALGCKCLPLSYGGPDMKGLLSRTEVAATWRTVGNLPLLVAIPGFAAGFCGAPDT